MANALTQKPIIIDTDITTYRADASVVALGGAEGVRVTKLILAVGTGAVSVAGTVTITAPSDSITIYPPIPIPAGQSARTILYTDEPTDAKGSLNWKDFAVTGVTATKTVLYLWTDV
jgi:hypothetical protein